MSKGRCGRCGYHMDNVEHIYRFEGLVGRYCPACAEALEKLANLKKINVESDSTNQYKYDAISVKQCRNGEFKQIPLSPLIIKDLNHIVRLGEMVEVVVRGEKCRNERYKMTQGVSEVTRPLSNNHKHMLGQTWLVVGGEENVQFVSPNARY